MHSIHGRRHWFAWFALVFGVAVLAAPGLFAGGAGEAATGTTAATTDTAMVSQMEAPMLAAMVADGSLPPLEERLPDNPHVLEVAELGIYGGTFHRAFRGPSDWLAYGKFATSDGLVRFDPDPANGFVPGLAESWEWNEDKTSLTFSLRKGAKWSDGVPFSAEDLAFYFHEVQGNDEIPETAPFTLDGNEVTLNVIDDYTVQYLFPRPYVFALNEGRFRWPHSAVRPAHYYKQFHPGFNDAVEGWDQFREKIIEVEGNGFFDIDRPVMQAWKVVSWEPGVRMVAERNPYYWKTDQAGRQLPYVDRVVHTVIKENKIMPLKAINGELSVQFRHFSFADFSLLKENEGEGNYNVLVNQDSRNGPALYINWDTPKENLRELLRNRTFRIALSQAMDRDAINRVVYKNTQSATSYTFAAGSEQYDAELAAKYASHDLARAAELFAEVGLKDQNGDGVLQYPDGEDVAITIWVLIGQSTWVDIVELVKKQWEEAGLKVAINAINRELYSAEAREPVGPNHDIGVWVTGGSSTPLARANRWGALEGRIPGGEVCWWQCSANRWFYTGGAEGEQPDPGIARIQELWSAAQQETDAAKLDAIAREINQLHADNVYNLGTTTMPAIGIVSRDLGNVPETFVMGNFSKGLAIVRPEQFFWRTPQDE